MIKLFGKGLGIFDHPFSVASSVSIDYTDVATGNIVDTSSRLLGNLGDQASLYSNGKRQGLSLDTIQTTVPSSTGDIRKNQGLDAPRLTQDTGIKPQLFSAESGQAPFETLFHDFDVEVFPFYNFWVPDELTNDKDERGDRKLEDIPRFVKVTWKTAPDLQDPITRLKSKDINKRPINGVMFSREIEKPSVFSAGGVSFSPKHLQSHGFSSIKSVIANGYLAPGVLETVVEMPLHNTGAESYKSFSGKDELDNLDEDAFLTNPDFAGVSIHELQSQVSQVTNGIANMSSIAVDGVSKSVAAQKDQLVDGKFIIKKASRPGGAAQIAGIHPSSPTLNFELNTATPSKIRPVDNVVEMASAMMQPASVTDLKSSAQVKVKFFNPAIGNLVQASKVNLMSSPHHVENMVSIANNLPSLEILSRTNLYEKRLNLEIPSLPSPRVKPFEYIGYVLEKYCRQSSGAFIKVEEIDIPSREADYYIDTKILYGAAYRYRIRAVFRWTRPFDQPINIWESDPSDRKRKGSHTAPLTSHKSSYFYSEWSHGWAYAACIDDQPPPPPDELTVRPDSSRKRVVVTFRLPDNPQRDILKMRLFRKYQDENGKDITHWMQVVESGATDRGLDFAPQNVIYFDNDQDFFQNRKVKTLYCAQTISRHGEDSVLSEQLAVRLNKDYFTAGEFPVEFISSSGVRIEYHGAFGTSPNKITKTSVILTPPPSRIGREQGEAQVFVSGRDTMGNGTIDDSHYVFRFQSLDTGEVRDIPVDLQLINLPVRQIVSKINFYVPTHTVSGKNSNEFSSQSDSKSKFAKLIDGTTIKNKSSDTEVSVYDRASPGDRWKR